MSSKTNAVNELRELLRLGEGKCISEESLILIASYISELETYIANVDRDMFELQMKYQDVSEYQLREGK
jgi:hypothetical protein